MHMLSPANTVHLLWQLLLACRAPAELSEGVRRALEVLAMRAELREEVLAMSVELRELELRESLILRETWAVSSEPLSNLEQLIFVS